MTMIKALILSLSMGAMTALVARSATDDNVRGFYWIDSNTPVAFTVLPSEIEASGLKDGFHTFNMVVCNDNGTCSTPESAIFIKVPDSNSSLKGTLYLDGDLFSTVSLQNTGSSIYACDVDMSSIEPGIHNIQLLSYTDSGTVSEIVETWFLRVPTETELSATKLACFIDGIYIGQEELRKSGTVYLSDIDTRSLESGIHSIDVSFVLSDGTVSSVEHGWFYRTPIPNGIKAYDYWFDDDYMNAKSVVLEQEISNFSLVTMIDIPDLPFDSRKYEFSILDGKPSVNGKHTLNMRFYESDGRAIPKTSVFIETRNPQAVENLETLSVGINHVTPEVNEIKWYKFYGEVGDSIMVCSDLPSMLELYSPLGREVMRKSGPQAQEQNTLTLMESGTYYFAAHNTDIRNRSDFDVSFTHVPRNAILSVSPETSLSNSTFTLIELFGNGMNDARNISIQSENGVKFEAENIFVMDNYHLSGTIKHPDGIPSGLYDVSMMVVDRLSGEEKTIVLQKALNFTASTESPEIKVEIVPSKKASTPYIVDIFVTNDSDIPCWGVPFNIACEREGGKNGFVIYLSDFLGRPVSANTMKWYESDNILGTGANGIFVPTTIAYMQPHEQRRLQVGIVSDPHNTVGLYAWAGTPYSEEARQLMSMTEESLKTMKVQYSNLFDLKTQAYILTLLGKIENNSGTKVRARASEDDNDQVLELIGEYGPDITTGKYKEFSKASDRASQAANIYVAGAKTWSSIYNLGGKGGTAVERLNKDCGYSGTPQEIIRQIEAQYPGCENDIDKIPDPSVKMWYAELKNAIANAVPPDEIISDVVPTEVSLAMQASDCVLKRNAESSNPMPTRNNIRVLMSGDPNMLTGYSDPSGGNYIGIEVKTLDYTVEFENDPLIANAAASNITVENNLEGTVFDLASFEPKGIKIGKHSIPVPNGHHFVKTFDMRPEIQCIAEIRLDYDAETGKALWKFASLDPITLNPIDDFRQGLLPVNNETECGIGYIDYSIKLKDNLEHNVTVGNKAIITFDDNAPIETPTWNNVTDYQRPNSKIVTNSGFSDGCYTLAVEYSDEGSGVGSYDLYIRTSESEKWHAVKSELTDTEIRFDTPEAIPGIQFMTLATDRAGNRQIYKDATITGIDDAVIDSQVDSGPELWYNIQGIPLSDFGSRKVPGIKISNKGRKIIVK